MLYVKLYPQGFRCFYLFILTWMATPFYQLRIQQTITGEVNFHNIGPSKQQPIKQNEQQTERKKKLLVVNSRPHRSADPHPTQTLEKVRTGRQQCDRSAIRRALWRQRKRRRGAKPAVDGMPRGGERQRRTKIEQHVKPCAPAPGAAPRHRQTAPCTAPWRDAPCHSMAWPARSQREGGTRAWLLFVTFTWRVVFVSGWLSMAPPNGDPVVRPTGHAQRGHERAPGVACHRPCVPLLSSKCQAWRSS